MKLCWRENPEERPTFTDIVTCLSDHLQSHAGYNFIIVDNIVDDDEVV